MGGRGAIIAGAVVLVLGAVDGGASAAEEPGGEASLAFLDPASPRLQLAPRPQGNDRVRTDDGWKAVDQGFGLEVVIRNFTLDRVDFELDRGSFFGRDQGKVEVDRKSFGVRLRTGDAIMGLFFGAFAERFELDGPRYTVGGGPIRFRDDVEAIGIEVGGNGSATLARPEDWAVEPVLDYELSLSYRYGDGDDVIDDLWFLEALARFGGGVEFEGFQVTAGVVGSAVLGGFDVDPGSGRSLEGSNLGAYLRAAYSGRDAPVTAHLQGMLGEVRGITAGFGLRF